MKTLIKFELKKIFSRRLAQLAILAVLLLSALFSFCTYRNMYACDGAGREGTGSTAVAIDRELAAKYEGPLTDEKVQQILAEFAPAFDLQGLNAAYLYQNAVQSAVFARFAAIDGSWNGLSVADVFGEEEIAVGYTYGWLKTSSNLVQLYVVLSLLLIVLLAPVFSGEYGGADHILLTSRYGKTKCAAAKVLAALASAVAVTAAVSCAQLVPALLLYGADGLKGSILFAPVEYIDGYIPFNITCGTLLRYQILLAFTGAISVAAVTLLLSAACKNPMAAAVSSAALYFLPVLLPVPETSALFPYIALLPVYHAQMVSLMSVARLGRGVLYAVWAVPVALALAVTGSTISRRIFARHQV